VSAVKGRRRKPAATARLRPFWLLIVALVLLVGAGAYVVLTLPVFRPREILARGTSVVSPGDVVRRAAIDRGQNMWLQNSSAIVKRVEEIPYVAGAHIERTWPGIETIVVVERTPYAIVPSTGGALLVDRDLRVLGPAPDGARLPQLRANDIEGADAGTFLSDPGLLSLRDDNQALLDARITARALEHDKYGDLVATLADGVRVLFGDDGDLQKKIPLVNPILNQVGRAGRPIAAIDLRAADTPVVIYKK
jgi:cell division septal protein FtsQ